MSAQNTTQRDIEKSTNVMNTNKNLESVIISDYTSNSSFKPATPHTNSATKFHSDSTIKRGKIGDDIILPQKNQPLRPNRKYVPVSSDNLQTPHSIDYKPPSGDWKTTSLPRRIGQDPSLSDRRRAGINHLNISDLNQQMIDLSLSVNNNSDNSNLNNSNNHNNNIHSPSGNNGNNNAISPRGGNNININYNYKKDKKNFNSNNTWLRPNSNSSNINSNENINSNVHKDECNNNENSSNTNNYDKRRSFSFSGTEESTTKFSNMKLQVEKVLNNPIQASINNHMNYMANNNNSIIPLTNNLNPQNQKNVNSTSNIDGIKQSKSSIEYEEYKRAAATQDFSQFKSLDILHYSGKDSLGRRIVMMFQANISSRNIDLDLLLLYLISILDPIVDSDYVLVFVASAVSKENRPSVAWLKKAYTIFNRKYKKNLKTLYIVHPNIWIKMTLKIFRPFISNKFWKKVSYIDDISDIYRTIDRNEISFPPYVIKYNKKVNSRTPVFGVPLDEVLLIEYSKTGVPEVIEKTVSYLKNCYNIEGIFRKSGNANYLEDLKKSFNRGEEVDLTTVEDPHVVAGLLKTFLRDLPDPLLTYDLYDAFLQTHQAMSNEDATWSMTMKKLLSTLPEANKRVTKIIFELFSEISMHSDVNLMTSANLSIVIAPNILKSRNENLMQVMQETPVVTSCVKKMIECNNLLWDK